MYSLVTLLIEEAEQEHSQSGRGMTAAQLMRMPPRTQPTHPGEWIFQDLTAWYHMMGRRCALSLSTSAVSVSQTPRCAHVSASGTDTWTYGLPLAGQSVQIVTDAGSYVRVVDLYRVRCFSYPLQESIRQYLAAENVKAIMNINGILSPLSNFAKRDQNTGDSLVLTTGESLAHSMCCITLNRVSPSFPERHSILAMQISLEVARSMGAAVQLLPETHRACRGVA